MDEYFLEKAKLYTLFPKIQSKILNISEMIRKNTMKKHTEQKIGKRSIIQRKISKKWHNFRGKWQKLEYTRRKKKWSSQREGFHVRIDHFFNSSGVLFTKFLTFPSPICKSWKIYTHEHTELNVCIMIMCIKLISFIWSNYLAPSAPYQLDMSRRLQS